MVDDHFGIACLARRRIGDGEGAPVQLPVAVAQRGLVLEGEYQPALIGGADAAGAADQGDAAQKIALYVYVNVNQG